jgi:excisionase family DNA binding protein
MKQQSLINSIFWDIEDLSHYLNVKVKTIYSMVPAIPHYRIGKLIRFKKAEIESWLESKKENVQEKIQQRKMRKSANENIDLLIRKTIDQTKQEDYNSCITGNQTGSRDPRKGDKQWVYIKEIRSGG